ncbi:AAA family ATPase [Bifidobacterium breve]|uniref:AAA family ATPase n=1 Tax=Bifidobacterium breve TaxID=1685 RepID=UPI001D15A21A|nr:AAA family ATPase [Bifidobacterium breve]
MKISSVIVRNHSRLIDCTLDVRENLILVGPNGSGKSSLIRCLDLLLGKTMQHCITVSAVQILGTWNVRSLLKQS